jgi:hypothetical protein
VARLVIRGPAAYKINNPSAVKPGDLISVHDDNHGFGRVELESDVFVCLHVAGVSPDELATYVTGMDAAEDGSTLVLQRRWAVDLGKIGLRTTTGVIHTTWDRLRPTLIQREQPGERLYIRGVRDGD